MGISKMFFNIFEICALKSVIESHITNECGSGQEILKAK